MNQREKWDKLLAQLPTHLYDPKFGNRDFECDASGWTWVCVGRNASHEFYVGHSSDFSKFAMKSCGEGREEGSWQEHVYRESADLDITLAGVYLGHH